jgi:hypothetical protein
MSITHSYKLDEAACRAVELVLGGYERPGYGFITPKAKKSAKMEVSLKLGRMWAVNSRMLFIS